LSSPLHVTDDTFEETIKTNDLVLIDFWATWCGPCLALAPIIDEIAAEYSKKAVVGKLDVDKNLFTAERFHVLSIPTLILFKNGQEVDRLVGLCIKNNITSLIDKHSLS
jgi:thioredoxin 1